MQYFWVRRCSIEFVPELDLSSAKAALFFLNFILENSEQSDNIYASFRPHKKSRHPDGRTDWQRYSVRKILDFQILNWKSDHIAIWFFYFFFKFSFKSFFLEKKSFQITTRIFSFAHMNKTDQDTQHTGILLQNCSSRHFKGVPKQQQNQITNITFYAP